LTPVEDLHGIGYLHRDVKPGNFAVGRAEEQKQRNMYILDYGLARRYLNETGVHRRPREKAGFRGTVG